MLVRSLEQIARCGNTRSLVVYNLVGLESAEQHLVNQPATEQHSKEVSFLWLMYLGLESAGEALTKGLSLGLSILDERVRQTRIFATGQYVRCRWVLLRQKTGAYMGRHDCLPGLREL